MFQVGEGHLPAEDFAESKRRTCSIRSDGSYEIVEVEDAAFTDFVDSHVLENFKLISRENSSEDYMMVVTQDSLKSSRVLSVCDSMSTLTMSTESNPSIMSSMSSLEGTWDRQESVTASSVGIRLTGSLETTGHVACQTTSECGERGLEDAECCVEMEKDGVFEHSEDTQHSEHLNHRASKDLKSYCCNCSTNRRNNFHLNKTSGSNTFPRLAQSPSFSSQNCQGTAVQQPPPRLTKCNSPLLMAKKSTGDRKKHVALSEGSEPEGLEYFSMNHSCARCTDPGRTYLKKKKAAQDVSRAFSEPNEKDLVDAGQLKLVEQPIEWLLKLSRVQPGSSETPELSSSPSVASSSPEVPQLEERKPSEAAIKKCIEKHSPDFLQYTDWKCLFPYLMSNQLLDTCALEMLNNNSMTSRDKSIKFYYEVLPSKGKSAYSRYYDSVAREQEHIGHQTLLELLDEFCRT